MLLGKFNDRRIQACYWFDDSGSSSGLRRRPSATAMYISLSFVDGGAQWSKLVKNGGWTSQSPSHNEVRFVIRQHDERDDEQARACTYAKVCGFTPQAESHVVSTYLRQTRNVWKIFRCVGRRLYRSRLLSISTVDRRDGGA